MPVTWWRHLMCAKWQSHGLLLKIISSARRWTFQTRNHNTPLPYCGGVTSRSRSSGCHSLQLHATSLPELTCHMGSHSVTCHPAEVRWHFCLWWTGCITQVRRVERWRRPTWMRRAAALTRSSPSRSTSSSAPRTTTPRKPASSTSSTSPVSPAPPLTRALLKHFTDAFRLRRTHRIDAAYCYRCLHVAWSVCLAHECAVQKRMNRSRCRLEQRLK